MSKKVAVVLCGSGYKDGSEIRESVATLLALEKLGVEWTAFAPNESQHDVVNCLNGQSVASETRNMLVESARITRGRSHDLKTLKAENFDALVLPGGFGAAKNLCTFALEGSQATVHEDLLKVMHNFHKQNKPIAAICIAPVIVGLSFPNSKIKVTLGAEGEASQELRKLGVIVESVKSAREFVADQDHKIFTTPAYMFDNATMPEVFEGIENCLQAALESSRLS